MEEEEVLDKAGTPGRGATDYSEQEQDLDKEQEVPKVIVTRGRGEATQPGSVCVWWYRPSAPASGQTDQVRERLTGLLLLRIN